MTILLVIVYVLVCLFLVMVVLLQQGKGADLAGAFGGGGSQTSFGPRAGTNLMHRMTTASFVLFVILSMALAIVSGKQRSSVMENVQTAPAAAVEQQLPAETAMEPAAGSEEGQTPAGDDAADADAAGAEEAAEQPATDPTPTEE